MYRYQILLRDYHHQHQVKIISILQSSRHMVVSKSYKRWPLASIFTLELFATHLNIQTVKWQTKNIGTSSISRGILPISSWQFTNSFQGSAAKNTWWSHSTSKCDSNLMRSVTINATLNGKLARKRNETMNCYGYTTNISSQPATHSSAFIALFEL